MYTILIRRSVVLSVLAVSGMAGCGGEPGARDDESVVLQHDSAGVSISSSTMPAWETGAAWHVEAIPLVSVGAVDGDARLLFNGVVAVRRLSNDAILVADGGSAELRFFDQSGAPIGQVGGRGEGPGEFGLLAHVALGGRDSIVAIDALRPRISAFSEDGELIGTRTLEMVNGAFGMPVTVSGSGAVLAYAALPLKTSEDSHIRDSVHFITFGASETVGREFVRLPFGERWRVKAHAGRAEQIPFVSRSVWAATREGYVTGTGERGELRYWAGDGSLRRVVRWNAARRLVTDIDREQYRAHQLASAADDEVRRRIELSLRELPFKDTMPVFQSLLVDDLGATWVEHYRTPWDSTNRWTVIDSTGAWLGEIDLPPGLRLFHATADEVLGVWRDDNRVEFARSYRLVRRQQ